MNWKRPSACTITLFILAALNARGQERDPDRSVLVPLLVDHVPGANGSIWTSTLGVTRSEDESTGPALIPAVVSSCNILCPTFDPSPISVSYLELMQEREPSGLNSWIVNLYGSGSEEVIFNLRFWDTAGSAQTGGVELPVIDLEDLPRGKLNILDVPAPSARYRSHLRLYRTSNLEDAGDYRIRVWSFTVPQRAATSGAVAELLFDDTVQTAPGYIDYHVVRPGYAFIDLGALVGSTNDERLRIEISAPSEDEHMYAFVSTTDNETNSVTVHLPEE